MREGRQLFPRTSFYRQCALNVKRVDKWIFKFIKEIRGNNFSFNSSRAKHFVESFYWIKISSIFSLFPPDIHRDIS